MIKKITVTYKQANSFDLTNPRHVDPLNAAPEVLRDEAFYLKCLASILEQLIANPHLSEDDIRTVIYGHISTANIDETIYTKKKKNLSIPYLFIHLEN